MIFRIMSAPPFSIEDVYNLVEMQGRVIGISFRVGSSSQTRYPYGITVVKIHNITIESILNNIKSNVHTEGVIVGDGYDNTILISEEPCEIQFNTNDIEYIEGR